jgi:hypothetical protein
MQDNNIIDVQVCPDDVPCVEVTDELPSAMEMAKNLMRDGTTILKGALGGNKTLADDSLREHRWAICEACPMLQNNRCTKCGCFMKVKVAFAATKCPLKKW